MRISAREYDRLPERLQALFYHVDGSDEVVAAFPETHGAGAARSGSSNPQRTEYNASSYHIGHDTGEMHRFGDSGSASRFFYSSKAGAQDRWGSRHPTVKPVELMKWLVALVCPPGGTVLDPFAGSGTTAVAALGTGRNTILIEREDQYVADILERVAFYEGGGAHSVQAKNRNRKTDAGPLFSPQPQRMELREGLNTDPLPEFCENKDSALSYKAAISVIGEQVKAGAPLPTGGYFGGEK